MNSPARRHFIRHTAAAAAAAAAPEAMHPDATVYELHLAQLADHKRTLHAIKSVERKIEQKRKLLPAYDDYVAGVITAGNGVQDDVLVTVMVWRIDTGDIDQALAIADYALAHKLSLPDQYKRDTATVVAEEVAEHALRAMAASTDPAPKTLIDQLSTAGTLTAGHDMPDEVRAKLHKALGYALRGHDNASALDHLQRAVELDPRVGVKKDIERLQREIKNNPPAPITGEG